MPEVHGTSHISPISSNDPNMLDHEMRSHLIGCSKIRQLELSLEAHFNDIESRLADIKTLHGLKQKVMQMGENVDASHHSDLHDLFKEARALGLDWNSNGWSSKEQKDHLMNALHVQITSRESDNQTLFMRVNRLMNLRSETANLFSKMVSDSHSASIRVGGRIHLK